jgi:hypothetical protein
MVYADDVHLLGDITGKGKIVPVQAVEALRAARG